MKIIVLDALSAPAPRPPGTSSWEPLSLFGRLEVFERTTGLQLLERAADAEIILTYKLPIGRDLLDILTRLRYIGVLSTSYDHIDVAYAARLGLPVTNIPETATHDRSIALAAANIDAWLRGMPANVVNGGRQSGVR